MNSSNYLSQFQSALNQNHLNFENIEALLVQMKLDLIASSASCDKQKNERNTIFGLFSEMSLLLTQNTADILALKSKGESLACSIEQYNNDWKSDLSISTASHKNRKTAVYQKRMDLSPIIELENVSIAEDLALLDDMISNLSVEKKKAELQKRENSLDDIAKEMKTLENEYAISLAQFKKAYDLNIDESNDQILVDLLTFKLDDVNSAIRRFSTILSDRLFPKSINSENNNCTKETEGKKAKFPIKLQEFISKIMSSTKLDAETKEFKIGSPFEVKHVAHVGYSKESHALEFWSNVEKIENEVIVNY
jgi:hypothetical protein